jgi:DnaJ-domain-containing protein 1
MAGGVMPKMVIEVPEEFTEVGKAMAEHLAALQRTVSRLGGGKAVDYAEIEQAMAESAGSRNWQATAPFCRAWTS